MNRKWIVVHHSATPEDYTLEQIRNIHIAQGYSDIGYNFIVNRQGLKTGRPLDRRAAHCVADKWPYDQYDMNWKSIGLLIIGDFSKKAADAKLINEAAYAVKTIANKYGIPVDREHVIGHYMASDTFCPGEKTMKDLYRKLGI